MSAPPRPADGPGRPEPLGVSLVVGGINIAVHAPAAAVYLCLFDEADHETDRIALTERTGPVVHGFIAGVGAGQRYGLRADGPFNPAAGQRFNPAKLLVDPYASRLDRPFILDPLMFGHHPADPDGDLRADHGDSARVMPKAVIEAPFDPGPVIRPQIPWDRTVLYEASVKGLTALNPAIPPALRGTFAGLGHPATIDYLHKLGITTLELLPAMAWIDERHLPALGLHNAWGYNPVSFCAPDPRLATGGWAEIRTAVAALQAAGLEVLLDVVLNHSGESDHLGPTLSLRGLDNAGYYRLRRDDLRYYDNDTGCGNSFAINRPAGLRLALDALRLWAERAGLDGFRFDLAVTLGRTDQGFDPAAPFLAALAQDPLLRGLKLIAEPWDIGPGGYHPGGFPALWGEWNDHFRDDLRRFWRGDHHLLGPLATRLAGSADCFGHKHRPSRSINFLVAHDGFTLADLVSYQGKHNQANGEQNRDGSDDNKSWNHGVEGPSADPALIAARRRDQKALIASLLVARGTPMLAMGQEGGRSQGGNNNSYAQDNALNWLDHQAVDPDLLAFTRRAIALRQAHPAVRADHFLTGQPGDHGLPDVLWLRGDGQPLTVEDWNDPAAGLLTAVFTAPTEGGGIDRVAVVIQRGWHDCRVHLPANRPGYGWTLVLNSAEPADHPAVAVGESLTMPARAVLVLAEQQVGQHGRLPPPADLLDRYAQALGIAPDWWDEMGGHHQVPDDSKQALIRAMGRDAGSLGAVRDGLAQLAEDGPLRPLPQTAVATAGQPVRLTLPDPGGIALDLVLVDPQGQSRAFTFTPTGPVGNFTAVDGRSGRVVLLDLGPLPTGLYRLHLARRPELATTLVVAPRRVSPLALPAGAVQGFGVGAHLYSLRRAGDQGIGDFTTLGAIGRAAGAHGAATLGINPLHALFAQDRERASPYHPSDRRFLDPIYIDVADLAAVDPLGVAPALLADNGRLCAALAARRAIDYPAVWALKRQVLAAAYRGFADLAARQPGSAPAAAFAAFKDQGDASLAAFARFEALAADHPGRWSSWPESARRPDGGAMVDPAAVDFACWLQWVADGQLAAADQAARAGGLALGFYRDLAVGAAPDGAETWAAPGEFALGASIGAPPDRFAAEGQVWNLPPPVPLAQWASNGAAFAALLAANMRHAGVLRIDHVMGLTRLFWVPDGASGRDGAYVQAPLDLLLARAALASRQAGVAIVGEDLGTVPDGFRERLSEAGILSYRVLWFERAGAAFRPPTDWPVDAVACVSTHDLPTLAGWWDGADLTEKHQLGQLTAKALAAATAGREDEKRLLLAALAAAGLLSADETAAVRLDTALEPAVAAAIHGFVTGAPSRLILAQAEDLAGEREAVNLPGTDRERPNWRRRLDPDITELFDRPESRAIFNALAGRRLRP